MCKPNAENHVWTTHHQPVANDYCPPIPNFSLPHHIFLPLAVGKLLRLLALLQLTYNNLQWNQRTPRPLVTYLPLVRHPRYIKNGCDRPTLYHLHHHIPHFPMIAVFAQTVVSDSLALLPRINLANDSATLRVKNVEASLCTLVCLCSALLPKINLASDSAFYESTTCSWQFCVLSFVSVHIPFTKAPTQMRLNHFKVCASPSLPKSNGST